MEQILSKLEDLKKEILISGDKTLLDLIERSIDHIIWEEFDSKHK